MAKDDDTLTRHPVPAGVRALSEQVVELAEVLQARSLSLDAPATREALVAVSEARARLDSLTLALAAHADVVKVGADSGATSTGVWWAVATRQNRRTAAGQVKLANALESRWHRVRDALADAAMSAEQARVVVRALDDLPDDIPADVVASAEQTLVELALDHDPDALALLGKRILSTVAPEVGEEADRKKVEADERRAQQKQRLTMSFDGHGARPRPVHAPDVPGTDAGEDPPRVRRPRPRQHHPGRRVLAGRATRRRRRWASRSAR